MGSIKAASEYVVPEVPLSYIRTLMQELVVLAIATQIPLLLGLLVRIEAVIKVGFTLDLIQNTYHT